MQWRAEARSSPPEGDSRFPDFRQELRSFAEATKLVEAPRCSYQNRPNGPGEPSPGLRPKADALGKQAEPLCGLKGRENLGWIEPMTVSRALAALQAALVGCAFSPGHRPPASALGWALPARWAGFVRFAYPC